ncbi:MAG: Fe-S cluster assembly protein HesB [Actinobacteria bacterium]|nr:Fe-S cluster assembly protein HesB [Actinomycetota bacterium]
MKLPLSGDPAADRLLEKDALALLIGMVLDQQIPLERAFKSPADLKQRLGRLDVHELAEADPDEMARTFAEPPALHRFPASMAKRVQELCRHLIDEYDGRAERVWKSAGDGAQLLANVKALPGFGDQKARIFVALLAKRLGVQPQGWQEAAGDYGQPGTFKSVADIDSPDALKQVRAYKQEMKARAKAKA